MVCLQAAIVIMALPPQSYGGVAYDSVHSALRVEDADALCNWYPLAVVMD